MDSELFFADIERGIFGSRSGNLYLTDPGTYNLRDDPFVVPYPFRIIIKDEYDPYIVIFTETGYMYILNIVDMQFKLKTVLPPEVGVIDSFEILDEGASVILKANKGSYKYENGWVNLAEPLDSLIVKDDQKVFAQATQLENELCAAIHVKSIEKFSDAMQKYLLYLANYSTEDVFIQIWYDLIKQDYPFEKSEVHDIMEKCIHLLSTVDRLSSYVDELNMSIKE
ncbi:hypothetical protein TRFO_29194 [Tritrichomonas foetus]|uniref:Uncharacterized protein n=1 Tax=Tritrichomonas foetus TaxID=1144522 RepID=A0A1J4JW77_9EUKA|nr:hypothetical protein TRFO_29194 [Tritrichomonas foetus]|eukprot:OHT03393.1 hypothetical protein TRFO_29194 [Tritrichomonas foetus]